MNQNIIKTEVEGAVLEFDPALKMLVVWLPPDIFWDMIDAEPGDFPGTHKRHWGLIKDEILRHIEKHGPLSLQMACVMMGRDAALRAE